MQSGCSILTVSSSAIPFNPPHACRGLSGRWRKNIAGNVPNMRSPFYESMARKLFMSQEVRGSRSQPASGTLYRDVVHLNRAGLIVCTDRMRPCAGDWSRLGSWVRISCSISPVVRAAIHLHGTPLWAGGHVVEDLERSPNSFPHVNSDHGT